MQAGEFLASSRSSQPTVQTTWHHVTVARVLATNGGIYGQNSSMEIACSKNHFRLKFASLEKTEAPTNLVRSARSC